jgi:NAD(P)-dependent dehydrogenase (short-subunit alcohol dehydrogenase family)
MNYSSLGNGFNKVTIITGGSRGIGEGCARVFVDAGASVIICARKRDVGEALAAELTTKGPGTCYFQPCDVTDPEDIKRLIDKTIELHGRLDCLINNAGRHPDHRPIDNFSIEEFEELLRLNLVSYFVACKYALPYLRQTQGNIINISSLVGNIGQEWAATYAATKGGITAFTKSLAVDEARHGVRVNVVLPGCIATLASITRPQELKELVASWSWLNREGTIEEVGSACLFLASDNSKFITGAELFVSGGAELAYGIKKPTPKLSGSIT